MSSALAVLRQRVSEILDDWSGTIATTSVGDSASVIATGLANLDGGADADYFNDHYVIITKTGHAALDEVKRATDYDGISDITTVAFSATVGSGTDFEVHRYSPTLKHACINTALRQSFNMGLWLPVKDETLVVDNILLNPDMETAGASPPVIANWTAVGSPTVTQESTRVWHGTYSAKVVAGAAAGQLTQNLFTSVNTHEVQGRTLNFKGRIFATAASVARLRVSFDGGSTFSNGAYHAGDDEWEGPGTMYVSVTIPAGATSMTFYCEVAASGTAFFDSLYAYIDSIYQYTVPTSILNPAGPSHVYYQADLNDEDGDYLELPGWYMGRSGETKYIHMTQKPWSGHRLRVEGKGALTSLSASTDTSEISGAQVDMVAEMAAAELLRRLAGGRISSQQSAYFVQQAQVHDASAEKLQKRPGVRLTGVAQYRRVMVIG